MILSTCRCLLSACRTFTRRATQQRRHAHSTIVRARYAPSPTGRLHLGGLRTALYNYLLVRQSLLQQELLQDNHNDVATVSSDSSALLDTNQNHTATNSSSSATRADDFSRTTADTAAHNGTAAASAFILRIEDTDQTRLVTNATEDLISVLKWCHLYPDEGPHTKDQTFGPYVQSQRLSLYSETSKRLLAQGHAYRCFCSPERLQLLRQQQNKAGLATEYDRLCRNLTQSQIEEALRQGTPHVVRLKAPEHGTTCIKDIVHGNMSWLNKNVEDQVLLKSDGYPTYHLAVVVDDHAMQVSHVVRGNEWLPSTPKHVILYTMLGYPIPRFAHLPLLLRADGSKLSKRHQDASVEHYQSQGFMPSAILNFVALLGWNPGTQQELFYSLTELAQHFSLHRVNKADAVVNINKLMWFNQQHLRHQIDTDLPALVRQMRPALQHEHADCIIADEQIESAFRALRDHVQLASHLVTYSVYFFRDPDFSTAASMKFRSLVLNEHHSISEYQSWLQLVRERLHAKAPCSNLSDMVTVIKSCHESIGCGQKALLLLLRYVLTGQQVGPSVSEIAVALGSTTVERRLSAMIESLQQQQQQI